MDYLPAEFGIKNDNVEESLFVDEQFNIKCGLDEELVCSKLLRNFRQVLSVDLSAIHLIRCPRLESSELVGDNHARWQLSL
jgi:hypothetical protein